MSGVLGRWSWGAVLRAALLQGGLHSPLPHLCAPLLTEAPSSHRRDGLRHGGGHSRPCGDPGGASHWLRRRARMGGDTPVVPPLDLVGSPHLRTSPSLGLLSDWCDDIVPGLSPQLGPMLAISISRCLGVFVSEKESQDFAP